MATQTETVAIPLQEVQLQQNQQEQGEIEQEGQSSPQPAGEVDEVQRWNRPRSNMYRVLAAFWSFILLGMNDASYGALIPYLGPYYNLTFTIISLIFLAPFGGYVLAALSNNAVHLRFGQRGVALIAPLCKLAANAVICTHPPYPALIAMYLVNGYGIGLEDAAWNAWIGNMAAANQLLGFLHGFYGLGATVGPLIATSLIVRGGRPWWDFYYIMIGGIGLELVVSAAAFWPASAAAFRAAHPNTTKEGGNRLKEALFALPAARVTWLCALFLFGYVGVEVALGGWIVTFMIRVREGTHFASGIAATGFWLGLTIGRFVLGFVTPKIGEKLAIAIYLPFAMGLELLFWLVPSFTVSAVMVGLLGFFLGPLFPAAVVATTKLLPKHLHVGAIGFAAAFGGSGAAIFPFAVGALAQNHGVQVLQPFTLALLAVILGLWLGLPRLNKKRE